MQAPHRLQPAHHTSWEWRVRLRVGRLGAAAWASDCRLQPAPSCLFATRRVFPEGRPKPAQLGSRHLRSTWTGLKGQARSRASEGRCATVAVRRVEGSSAGNARRSPAVLLACEASRLPRCERGAFQRLLADGCLRSGEKRTCHWKGVAASSAITPATASWTTSNSSTPPSQPTRSTMTVSYSGYIG